MPCIEVRSPASSLVESWNEFFNCSVTFFRNILDDHHQIFAENVGTQVRFVPGAKTLWIIEQNFIVLASLSIQMNPDLAIFQVIYETGIDQATEFFPIFFFQLIVESGFRFQRIINLLPVGPLYEVLVPTCYDCMETVFEFSPDIW